MSQPAHPISLKRLVFTKVLVEAIPNHAPNEEHSSVPPHNSIEVRPAPDQPRLWLAAMRTIVNAERDPSSPYHVDIQCAAQLTSDESLGEQEARRGVLITAHSVLFGAIRETVSWLTGRQPYGPLLLGLSVLSSQTSQKNTGGEADGAHHDDPTQ